MSELIDRERFSADMRDFQNRVGIWRDEAEDTETRTRADAALATIIETKLILDKQPTIHAPRWHRCEDELPPAHENLLCCGSRGGMFVGWVLGSAVCICGSCTGFVHGGKGRQFTHWMPLPEPPKEDA